VCLGAQARAANENARRRYKYENERRERNWMQTISIYNAQKNQYEIDVANAGLAQRYAYTEEQFEQNKARDAVQIKYQDLYREMVENSDYGKLMSAGRTGQSIRRMKTMELAKFGRDTTELGRQVLVNDRELAKQRAATEAQLKGFKEQAFTKVAFQPIPDVAPPQPVMQNVGAAAFTEALSIGMQVASPFIIAGSDRRLKENIKKIGESISGLGIYTFNYIGEVTKYIGTMADEVLKVKPEAVTIRDGYMHVKYGLIDVNFEEIQ
jgi:hypothetical protein